MHLELVVPALLAAQPVPRLPALELLFARARAVQDEPLLPEPWLARAFGVTDEPPAAGALTLLGTGEDPGDGFWMRADPVHLDIGRDGPALAPLGSADIAPGEADALAAALNEHFGAQFALAAVQPQRWCLRAASDMPIDAPAPAAATGSGELLPQGAASRRALALLTEIQLVLHGHAVNQAREQRGQPSINSVWLWGAGRLPRGARAPWQSVCSDDPFAAGLARLGGVRHGALPAGASQWLAQAPPEGRHLCVFEPVQSALELQALEQRWFAPLLQALREGRAGMVTLRTPEAGVARETTRADLRRFWRRPRPLAADA